MIISCSRRTDIPAFYSDWLFKRLREEYVLVQNPLNTLQVRKVSLAPGDVDGIVFWTKNPAPLLGRLHLLQDYTYYFQFTLTPYGKDIEPHLPPKEEIIDSFRKLSDKTGKQRTVWRYDPILLSEKISTAYHIDHFGNMAERLSGYTGKCIISFLDIYRHRQNEFTGLSIRPPDAAEMHQLAKEMAVIASRHNIELETCAEQIDLADLGIKHGRCIEARLIATLSGRKLTAVKDKYQRKLCGCSASIDIGQYNTCRHFCKYCYANSSSKILASNLSRHQDQSPLLIGEIENKQQIIRHKIVPFLKKQADLFN